MSNINDRTTVPLYMVISAIAVFISATLWLQATLADINMKLATIQRDLTLSISERELQGWIDDLRRSNPQITIPPVPRSGQ